jgi:hypothetical protein
MRDGHLPRFHGHDGGPHVHDRPDHLDHRFQRLHHHNHGGGADPICIDYFPDTGIDYNYAGSGSACTSTITDHANNSSTPSSLPGRKLDNTDLIDSIDRLGGKLSFTLALVDSLQE